MVHRVRDGLANFEQRPIPSGSERFERSDSAVRNRQHVRGLRRGKTRSGGFDKHLRHFLGVHSWWIENGSNGSHRQTHG